MSVHRVAEAGTIHIGNSPAPCRPAGFLAGAADDLGRTQSMGTKITLMNAGPTYKLTSAFSLAVSVETQDEIDHLTATLTEGGGHLEMCGWLVDAFGLSWQIVPTALFQLMGDPDPEVGTRVQAAMLQMQVLNIAGLQAAALGA